MPIVGIGWVFKWQRFKPHISCPCSPFRPIKKLILSSEVCLKIYERLGDDMLSLIIDILLIPSCLLNVYMYLTIHDNFNLLLGIFCGLLFLKGEFKK